MELMELNKLLEILRVLSGVPNYCEVHEKLEEVIALVIKLIKEKLS